MKRKARKCSIGMSQSGQSVLWTGGRSERIELERGTGKGQEGAKQLRTPAKFQELLPVGTLSARS